MLADRIFITVFPQACLLCGAPLGFAPPGGVPVCPDCDRAILPISGARCEKCSQPLTSEQGLCMRCRTREFAFDAAFSLFRYDGAVRDLIAQYKFRGNRRLSGLFARHLAVACRERYSGIPIVPVPARPSGKRKRGWDHVEAILECLVRFHRIPALHLLVRKNGAQQKSLDFSGRMSNLNGLIAMSRAWRTSQPTAGFQPSSAAEILRSPRALPRSVVLLDDIFTTGATASECSRVLRSAGVESIQVLTIAID